MTQQTEPPPISTVTRPVGNSAWTVGSEGSREELVQVTKLSFFRKASRKRLELVLVILVLVCLILLTALSISVYLLAANETVDSICITQQCLRSASTLLLSMNSSANPCDNFYEYACGKWNKEHFISSSQMSNDWYLERSYLSARDIRNYVKQNDSASEPLPVHQARTFFRSCQDFGSMNKVGLQTLWKLFEEIGLPQDPPIDTKEPKQSISITLGRLYTSLSMSFLLGFGIVPNPTNNTINKMAVSFASDLLLPTRQNDKRLDVHLHPLMSKGDEEIVKTWKVHAGRIMSYYAKVRNVTFTDVVIDETMEKLAYFFKNISEIEKDEKVIGPIFNDVPDEMTVTELQKLADNETATGKFVINFREYFTELYKNIDDIDLDLDGEDTILVYKKDYFVLLAQLLDDYDAQFIELAIWWKIAYALASHTNEHLADLKQIVNSKTFDQSYTSRESLCVDTVYGFMTLAISYQVVQDETLLRKSEKVHDMLKNIQTAFISLVRALRWMDTATKKLTIEKVNAVKKMVGFPAWMMSKEKVEEYYQNVTIDEGNHLANVISILKAETYEELRDLRIPYNTSYENFDPLDINAYYSPSDNSITVPAGILQFPFFDLGLEALNYGAIGVVLGHELTHGFDNTGRLFDKDGNMKEWWNAESLSQYEEKIECFVDAYDHYLINSINRTVNGNLTLGENLADNGGIRESLMAYRHYVQSRGKENKLPGLLHLSHEQLFFLSFANIWCGEFTDSGMIDALDDEHSPHPVRVVVTLQNLPEFADVWKCPAASPMNPSQKCKLWTN